MTPPYYVDIEVLEKLKEYRYTPRKSGYETLFWCDEQGVDYAQQDCTATKFFPINWPRVEPGEVNILGIQVVDHIPKPIKQFIYNWIDKGHAKWFYVVNDRKCRATNVWELLKEDITDICNMSRNAYIEVRCKRWLQDKHQFNMTEQERYEILALEDDKKSRQEIQKFLIGHPVPPSKK